MAPSNAVGCMFAALLVVAAAAGAAPLFAEPATASHEPEASNFTVEPMNRSPGATDVKYGLTVVAQAGTDLQTLEKVTAVYEEGSWAQCGSSDGETLGIDRGSTYDGYETDESVKNNIKRFSAGEDSFELVFNGESDFGASTNFNDGDEFVSVANCLDNPDEPGWYQIKGTTTGVTADGERVTFGSESHYFWIGDFENEQEARAELGPPPSEPQATATPTPEPTAEPSSGDGSDTESEGEPAGTNEVTSTPTATATATPTPATAPETPTAEPTATPTPPQWEGQVVQSPTPGDGPGFGPAVAVLSLLATALLVRRR
ncbi:PGF-CTERM sorting domain-containing protein [Natronomonas halophila]|uniref:PGF-CTERM sorting domain-containing protein n=1 Tax=Natronomonas halophila TaxID=2747817 RepID=UPI0015B58D0D|nr:PGF-CTERM sorting domain-containing protein [Natronomonas halophila]QLD87338.1 PGF-CTERM sorting domain-containing protein [Natronomonas halophila]